MSSMSLRLIAVACLSVAALGGCSGSGDTGDDGARSLEQIAADARESGFVWQAELLDDGDITLAEYDEAHRRSLECLDTAGLTYSKPERNIPNGYTWLFDAFWEGMDEEAGNAALATCMDENVRYLDLAMSAWGEWTTDAALLADVVECVEDSGIAVPADAKNYREVWLAGADQGLTREAVGVCVTNGMQRLYPGAGYGIGL